MPLKSIGHDSKIEELKMHIRYVWLVEFKKQVRKFLVFMAKATSLTAKSETGFQFHSGDTSLRDEPRPGHSLDLDKAALRQLVE